MPLHITTVWASYSYNIRFSFNAVAPLSSPQNFAITVDSPRVLTFTWDPPLEDSPISSYQLSCDPQPEGFPRTYNMTVFNDGGGVAATESGFTPSTTYNCSVLASNSIGDGPSASAMATTPEDCECL